MTGTAGARSKRARFALGAYRALGRALNPVLGPWLALRTRRGKEMAERLGERRGRTSVARPAGPLVWVHAASVGELNSVLPLAHRLRRLGLELLVTTGTVTSARIAAKRLPEGAIHQFQTLDIAPGVQRFLDHWRPDLAVFVESEMWPVTLDALSRRGVHQIMINARLSDRSYRRWRRRPELAGSMFSQLGHVFAQSQVDAERFRALGSPSVSVTGNLKADTTAPVFDAEALESLKGAIGERPVWTAASLHRGEDAAIAEAVRTLADRRAEALAIVVPRHPERGDAMRALFEAQGLCVAQRSRKEAVEPETQVLLADTLGEMGLWYRLAPIAFMGRSLAPEAGAFGGQNPIEPVACGAVVFTGRAVENFRETYRALLLDGGARVVDDARMLADFVEHVWTHESALDAMREGGRKSLERIGGALDRTVAGLDPWLAPMRMKAMLEQTRSVSEKHVAGLSAARMRAIRDAEIAGRPVPFRATSQAAE